MVELRDVSKQFADFIAVEGVDLTIRSGEFLTLLGPSGCGKTTLLRMISGFETPTTGRVFLDQQDVTALPPYRRDVNQVFQSYALFPHLNVDDNIAFGLRMKRIPREERTARVREAIEMVALGGFESRKPSQLSGGQKQRVALARALVCRPKVLLLDEPLAALDAKLRHAMQIELKRLQERVGITFVFVTHDQEEALVMSDRIAVMNRGRIEQLGPAMEVYLKPATAYVADFLGQANVLDARLISRNGQIAELLIRNSLRVHVCSQNLPNGDAIGFVSIRPERILLDSSPGDGNRFCATIRRQISRGATQQLLVSTDFAEQLTILAPPSQFGQTLRPGDQIQARINPEDIVVLPPAGR